MSTTTIVILGVIVLAVILLAMLAMGRAGANRPRLKPLAPEALDRYGSQWDRIEARFVDAPEEAVREADGLLTSMLREREHPMTPERLPNGMRKARRLGMGEEGRGGTEGMRLAMLQYRKVMEEYGHVSDDHQHGREERPEIAS